MKKIILAGAAALCLSNFATASTISNGSFETGDATDWFIGLGASGTFDISTTDAGEVASDGTYFANLTADAILLQELTWYEGSILKFDWNFISNDILPYNDYAFFQVLDPDELDPAKQILEYDVFADIDSLGNNWKSGWQTYHHTFTSSGSGLIGIGVANLVDTTNSSQLFVDNVSVPEPISLGLIGVALAGLGLARRRCQEEAK